ncbi:uncharacterized protein Z518_05091 [Rhinocladiella mackenziei CBS 650.93]|uniref:DUF3074 domain-containing protein n=1 Tax=Rhinocladiella mackenziei CBS 650.93 TaxID=1442369 RepID=A0A0D2IMV4_9EURO|nr:uncharacterized protein Z518_05091 [Rhinocladiella mackenziei CBS 650.93]KIX07114.1 hypothetical protein Z518_05091 [Rhinocladiella mackenziei CBS 650.93]
MAQEQSIPSNLVRLAPLQIGDLPAHPDLPMLDSDSPSQRPDLAAFITAILDDGASFLDPSTLSRSFKHHSRKSSPPSAAHVEVLTHSIPASSIAQIPWSDTSQGHDGTRGVSRSKPRSLGAEYWVARKSIHKDISSKSGQQPGNASWAEFIYGLRDEHSKHESEFTPTLFDALNVVNWNDSVRDLELQGKLVGKSRTAYTGCTMGVWEMCHALPAPLSRRCFPVLVVTASMDENAFIVVTIPVTLGMNVPAAFYSNGRNVKEGKDAQQRKQVVMGVYAAVETVRRDLAKGEVEWIMATASDAKGNLPMCMQKLGIPGAVVKDVGSFMKWIKDVDDKDIPRVE